MSRDGVHWGPEKDKTIYQFDPTLFSLDSTFNGANGLCTGQVMFKANGRQV